MQIKVETAKQRAVICLRGWFETDLGEALLHEVVDGVHPGRDLRFDRLFIGPVLLVGGTLLDPFFEDVLLSQREFFVRVRRRHEVVLVGRQDPGHEFTLADFAGNEGLCAYSFLADVEPQIGLTMLRVVAVAVEAVVAQNGPHIAVELDLGRDRRLSSLEKEAECGE